MKLLNMNFEMKSKKEENVARLKSQVVKKGKEIEKRKN